MSSTIPRAKDFPFDAKVVEISADSSIYSALKKLVRHGILSAPVRDKKAKRYLGFFDIADVLALLHGIELLKSIFPASKLRYQHINVHGIDLDLGESNDGSGLDLRVRRMVEQPGGHTAPWNPVDPEADFATVVQFLGKKTLPPWSPCRRVPVVDPSTKRVIKVISQSEVVTQLYKAVTGGSSEAEPPLFIQTPRTHKIGLTKVATITLKEPARKAFEYIINKRISAVAVVESADAPKLVSVISNKDIWLLLKMRVDKEKRLKKRKSSKSSKGGGDDEEEEEEEEEEEGGRGGKGDVGHLGEDDPQNLPAAEFVEQARLIAKKNKMDRSEVTSVTLDTPVHVIITTLAKERTHRVFVVDDKEVPVGVISVSDIVQMMVDEELPWPTSMLEKHMAGS